MRARPRVSLSSVALWGAFALSACGPVTAISLPPVGAIRDQVLAAACNAAAQDVRAKPDDAAPWAALAMLLDANGFFVEAAAAYERAVALRPTEAKWWYHRATLLEREDRYDEALDAAATAERLVPGYPPLSRNVALWHLARGRLLEAETAARRAVALSRGSSAASVVLGRVLLEQGREDEAAGVLATALTDWPPAWGDPRYVRFLLATARRRAGLATDAPDAAAADDVRFAIEPPALPDPWRAELIPLRMGATARKRR